KAGNEIEAANCRLASLPRDQPDDPVEMPTFHEPVANCRASGTPGNGRFQGPPAAPEKPAMPAFSAVASLEPRYAAGDVCSAAKASAETPYPPSASLTTMPRSVSASIRLSSVEPGVGVPMLCRTAPSKAEACVSTN